MKGYVVKYDGEPLQWARGEENNDNWSTLEGSGSAEIVAKDSSKKFSGCRFYNGTENSSITITSVILVK